MQEFFQRFPRFFHGSLPEYFPRLLQEFLWVMLPQFQDFLEFVAGFFQGFFKIFLLKLSQEFTAKMETFPIFWVFEIIEQYFQNRLPSKSKRRIKVCIFWFFSWWKMFFSCFTKISSLRNSNKKIFENMISFF